MTPFEEADARLGAMHGYAPWVPMPREALREVFRLISERTGEIPRLTEYPTAVTRDA